MSSSRDIISTVFVVDDDEFVREALESLIQLAGWRAQTFASADLFLASPPAVGPSCLVLDVNLPGLNGLDLQALIGRERSDMPIIFITGHGDVPMSVKAMKAGAVEFLMKPFGEEVLRDAIAAALERSREAIGVQTEVQALRACYATLSRREREVMAGVVSGLLNKQVGGNLGISEITVKKHRGRVMEKMHAKSLPELVSMNAKLGPFVSSNGREADG